MAEPFIGEISLFPYSQIPQGWALCDGALLNIGQNSALYALMGDAFGGDGKTNFRLPDLRGRAVIGMSSISQPKLALGTYGGAEQVVLLEGNLPTHTHFFIASGAEGATSVLKANYLAKAQATPTVKTAMNLYAAPASASVQFIPLHPEVVGSTGGVSQASGHHSRHRKNRRHQHHDDLSERQLYPAVPSEALHAPPPPQAGGAAQGHDNMQPFLALAYCIALEGYFPQNPYRENGPDGPPHSDPDGHPSSPDRPEGSPSIETE